MRPPETERTRLRRERRERERFLKHAIHFFVKDDAEAQAIKIALERQFPGIKVLVFKDEVKTPIHGVPSVAYQPGEGQRALTCFFLMGWFMSSDRDFETLTVEKGDA